MREYEALVVLSSQLDDEGVSGVIGKMTETIGRHGGTVASTGQLADKRGNVAEIAEGWKPRKLAYAIRGQREGYYVVLRFQAPAEAPGEFERWLELSEQVLRYLVMRTDEE